MSTWYSATTPDETERLVGAWPDAPVENVEVCGFILEAARDQVIAYAPAQDIPPVTGTIVPGAPTLTRQNLFPNPSVVDLSGFATAGSQHTLTHTGSTARFTFGVTTAIGIGVNAPLVSGVPYRFMVRARASKALQARQRIRGTLGPYRTIGTGWEWFELTGVANVSAISMTGFLIDSGAGGVGDWLEIDRVLAAPSGDTGEWFDGNSADRIDAGRTYSRAWEGPQNASTSVETYVPDLFVPDPPEIASRLVYAQLQQAKNLLMAGSVARGGEYGEGEFSYEPRPLDKAIKNLIRPIDGKIHVL